jgi:hypothetical protein
MPVNAANEFGIQQGIDEGCQIDLPGGALVAGGENALGLAEAYSLSQELRSCHAYLASTNCSDRATPQSNDIVVILVDAPDEEGEES